MSAPSSNTGGQGNQGGQPSAESRPIVPRHLKSQGGFVDYRGPAPEAPVPTVFGLTTRNEELGLIHLQESIPWQWGPVTPVGEVVPEALQDLTDLVDSWAITIMHSNPFTIPRPYHADYVNTVFYEMPDGGWMVFDLLTGVRLDMWRIMFVEDSQQQDPTGIGSIDWRQSFPGLIQGAVAAAPSGGPPQNQQGDGEAAANTIQEDMSEQMPPGSVSHGPPAATTSSGPQMADTPASQDPRSMDQLPPSPTPDRTGQQQGGLVLELDDEPTIQQPDVPRSPSVPSTQVSEHPVQQDFHVPEYPQTANPGNVGQLSPSPADGRSEQWAPAPPSAYTDSHDNFPTNPSFEEEGIIDLTKLVAPTSRSSNTRVPPQTTRAQSESQPSRRSAPSSIPAFIPRCPASGRRFASSRSGPHLPSHASGRTVVWSPSGAIPRSQPRARPMAQHSAGGPLQFRPRSRPVVVPTVEDPPLSIDQLLMPPSPIQGTRAQVGPSAPGQQGNPPGPNKRRRASGLEGDSGDREARRVRMTQEDDAEDLHLLEPFPSAYQTPTATGGSDRATLAARARARRREAQAEDFNALPLQQRDVAGGRGQTYPATSGRPLPPTSSGSSRSTSREEVPVSDAYELSQWTGPAHAASVSLGPRFPGPERTPDPPRSWNAGITGNQPPHPAAVSNPWNTEQERPLPQTANPQPLNAPMPAPINFGPTNATTFDAAANMQLDEETQAWFDGLPDLQTAFPWNPTDQDLLNMGPSAPRQPAQIQSTAVNDDDFDDDGFMTGAAMTRWAASTVAPTEGMAVEGNVPNQPRTEDFEGAIAMPRRSQFDIDRERSEIRKKAEEQRRASKVARSEMRKKAEEQRRASAVASRTTMPPERGISRSVIEETSTLSVNQHTAADHPSGPHQTPQTGTPANNTPADSTRIEDSPDNDSLFNDDDDDDEDLGDNSQ
ncbi:MAG: hypothetical protein LQ350_006125 [Teloschistes chrysophthalmus]|nr:MAG: hypothetical protein LQ350_006125 [Niorma chrysophthalma]